MTWPLVRTVIGLNYGIGLIFQLLCKVLYTIWFNKEPKSFNQFFSLQRNIFREGRKLSIFFILTAMLIIRTHLIFQKKFKFEISQISLQITLKWIKNSENQNFCQLWNYGIIQIKVEKFLFIFLAECNFGYNRYTIYWGIFVYFENSKSHIVPYSFLIYMAQLPQIPQNIPNLNMIFCNWIHLLFAPYSR